MPHEGHVRLAWGESLVLWAAMLLLVWGCYSNGAFLRPTKTVFAIGVPAIGLMWALPRLILAARRHARPETLRRTEWLFLGLGTFGALSALWSLAPADSLWASGTLFGGLVFLHLGYRLPRISAGAVSGVLFMLGEVGAILSAISVVSWFLRLSLFTQPLDGSLLVVGSFGYANAFAAFLLLTLAATAAFYGCLRRDGPRGNSAIARLVDGHRHIYLLAMAVPQLAALVLTRAKAPMAIAGFLLLMLLVQWLGVTREGRAARRLRFALIVFMILVIAGAGLLVWRDVAPQMAVSGLPEAATGLPEANGAPQTEEQSIAAPPMTANAYRVKTWTAGFRAVADRPWLGHGLDTFLAAYSPYKLGGHTAYAHSIIVQQLVELGIVGLLVLLAFFAFLFVGPIRSLRRSIGDPRVPLLLGTLAFALHNLVDLSWYFPALLMLFMLLSGLLLSWRPAEPDSRPSPAETDPGDLPARPRG